MRDNCYMNVNLLQFRKNMNIIRQKCGGEKGIIPVLKANAYGHGMVEIARAALSCGCGMLAVSRVDEAVLLRDSGIDSEIVILYQVPENSYEELVYYGLTPSVTSVDMLNQFSAFTSLRRVKSNVHIAIDTGMGNFGITEQEYIQLYDRLWYNPFINIRGLFTHFVSAYSDNELCFYKQKSIFDRCVGMIPAGKRAGVTVHAASSPAFLKYGNVSYDAVRLATALYGMPVPNCPLLPGIEPILEIKSVVADIRKLNKGDKISGYDMSMDLTKDMRVAVLPTGYGDFWWLSQSHNTCVLIGGKRIDAVGPLYMDRMLVDVTDMESVNVGDEVVLLGKQGKDRITIEEICEKCDIRIASAETVGFAYTRVPRVYRGSLAAKAGRHILQGLRQR